MKSILTQAPKLILCLALCFPVVAFAGREGDGREKSEDHHSQERNFTCGDPDRSLTLGEYISKLDPEESHTIRVYGTCHENITVSGFSGITLLAAPGASITDSSSGTMPVISVVNTANFDLEGFTVSGGLANLNCVAFSKCLFTGNTFQGPTGDGVNVIQSRAFFKGDIIQDHSNRGLSIANGSLVQLAGVTIQNNTAFGVNVVSGSTLTVLNSTIQNNGGTGIIASNQATVRASGSIIQNNAAMGISANAASVIWLENVTAPGNIITHNVRNGVRVADSSFAQITPGNVVTGNGAPDVACAPQFAATRGALTNIGGGTTNCIEP